MNPVFWVLIFLMAAAVWFLMAFIFYPLGRFLWRIGKDTMDELNREDKENNDKEDEQ